MHWLGYYMTHDSWVTKEDIEEHVPEVLAMCNETLVNAVKHVL